MRYDDFEVQKNPNEFTYSFSGADAKMFTYFPQAPELIRPLDTAHTISISVHESKGMARALGHRGIKGVARGVRTIAGSLIVTVINDHPLRSLMKQYEQWVSDRGSHPQLGWSVDRDLVGVGSMLSSYDLTNRLPTLLPPFDLAIQYVSESGRRWRRLPSEGEGPLFNKNGKFNYENRFDPEGAGVLLKGVEFIDDGLVTSTNDIVSEMTFSFIACDYKPMAKFQGGHTVPSRTDELAAAQASLFAAVYTGSPFVNSVDDVGDAGVPNAIREVNALVDLDEE